MEYVNIKNPMFLVLGIILIAGIVSNTFEQFWRLGFIFPEIVFVLYVLGFLGFWFGIIYMDDEILERYKKDSLVRFEVLRELMIPTKVPLQACFTMLYPAFLITSMFPRNLWNF